MNRLKFCCIKTLSRYVASQLLGHKWQLWKMKQIIPIVLNTKTTFVENSVSNEIFFRSYTFMGTWYSIARIRLYTCFVGKFLQIHNMMSNIQMLNDKFEIVWPNLFSEVCFAYKFKFYNFNEVDLFDSLCCLHYVVPFAEL